MLRRVPLTTGQLLMAAAAGLASIIATVAIGGWATGAFDGPKYDGDVVLDEPGIYQQPLDDVNGDVSGRRLPDIELVTAEGANVALATYRGAPMVINVWFSNCAPCRKELGDFAKVHAEVGDEVQFVGVNPFDRVDAMERFATERGVEYDLLRDPERSFVNEIGIVAYPVTLFVDADGRILRQTGQIDAGELRAAIAELF